MAVNVGQVYERLRVIEKTSERRHGQIVWLCECTCGKQVRVVTHSLVRGATRSCGCLAREVRASRRHDLLGQRFGRLMVRRALPTGLWLCECDCGNWIEVSTLNLRQAVSRGQERSCGCTRAERIRHMSDGRKMGNDTLQSMRVDGTVICALRPSAASRNSQTGVKGVSPLPNGKYRASISLKRKHYYLGAFDTIDEAARARAEAEERLFDPIVREWENSKKE